MITKSISVEGRGLESDRFAVKAVGLAPRGLRCVVHDRGDRGAVQGGEQEPDEPAGLRPVP